MAISCEVSDSSSFILPFILSQLTSPNCFCNSNDNDDNNNNNNNNNDNNNNNNIIIVIIIIIIIIIIITKIICKALSPIYSAQKRTFKIRKETLFYDDADLLRPVLK